MRRSSLCSSPFLYPSEIRDLYHDGSPTLVPRPSPGIGKPLPPPLFSALAKKWVTGAGDDEALENAGYSLRATTDLSIRTLGNTVHAAYEILLSLAGRQDEGVDWLNLLGIDGEGIVSVLHSHCCVAGGGTGNVP